MTLDFGTARNETVWQPEPGNRGTYGLLSSCVITMVLCVWTAVHLNIPEIDEPEIDEAEVAESEANASESTDLEADELEETEAVDLAPRPGEAGSDEPEEDTER